MTEHKIDLDLVELRCKLRGWQYLRREDGAIYGGWGIATPDGITAASPAWEFVFEELGRPRLTLAEIVASPPEGWRVASRGRDVTAFVWRTKYDMPDGSLSDGACVIWHSRGHTTEAVGAREPNKAAAHRAVAELLVLLGEVE